MLRRRVSLRRRGPDERNMSPRRSHREQAATVQEDERFSVVYAACPAGIVETDLHQRITHCNSAFATMVGLTEPDIVGRAGSQFLHPDGPKADVEGLASLLAGTVTSHTGQRLLARADGTALPVVLDWAVVRDVHGQPASFVCVVTDISAQAAMHTDLVRARERAEVMWTNAPIGVVEGSIDGTILAVNEALATMLGYQPEQLVGRPIADLSDPVLRPEVRASMGKLLNGELITAERRYLAADGRLIPVHVSTSVQRDEHGHVTRVTGFVVDMSAAHTQRTALQVAVQEVASAHTELARRQGLTDALLETVDIGIIFCDADGQAIIRNRAERRMIGLDDSGYSLHPEGLAPAVDVLDTAGNRIPVNDQPLMRALRGDDVGPVDLLLGPPGGPYREVIARGSQITDAAGDVHGAVVSVNDVTAERTTARALAEEHSQLAEAQRLGKLGSFTFDVATETFRCSEELYRIWGLAQGADLAAARRSMIHPDDLERVLAEWDAVLRRGGRTEVQYRITRPDGQLRYLRVVAESALDADGQPRSLQGTHLDVTDLTTAQRDAVEANTFFQAVLAATPDYTFVTDLATGAVVYGTPQQEVLGLTSSQLAALGGEAISTLIHPDDQLRLRAANAEAAVLDDGQVLQLRYRARHANGEWRWLSRRVTPFRRDPSGLAIEVLGVIRDITDVVQVEETLTHAALHDSLTGLPNRALLIDRLDSALARAERDRREVAVLFCDLDGFKRVNDTAGHAAGDAVLLETSQRLLHALREYDTVARIGGDEFVIVVEPWNRVSTEQPTIEQDRLVALKVADRVADVLRQPIIVDGVEFSITVSIGVTHAALSTPGNTRRVTADQVLQDADTAMYRAKSHGKDRFEVFEHGLRTDLAERGRVEQLLRQALKPAITKPSNVKSTPKHPAATLTAAYQPVFDSDTGRLTGFEALARLTDPDGNPIPPDVFIGIAEDTALIRPLGTRMLDLACHQLTSWRADMPGLEDVTMAVNVSALQARHASLEDDVRTALTTHGLNPADLILELTETALLEAAHSTINTLDSLRAAGVGIAIDDFGTGYASLRYLATLPVTAVKIDRSFTAGIPHDETCCKIVKAVAGLAADMNLDCIVEGVETPQQRAALPPGVQLQGYLTGRPSPPSAINLVNLVMHTVT